MHALDQLLGASSVGSKPQTMAIDDLLGVTVQQQQPSSLVETFDLIDLSANSNKQQQSDFELLSKISSGGQAEESKVHRQQTKVQNNYFDFSVKDPMQEFEELFSDQPLQSTATTANNHKLITGFVPQSSSMQVGGNPYAAYQ